MSVDKDVNRAAHNPDQKCQAPSGFAGGFLLATTTGGHREWSLIAVELSRHCKRPLKAVWCSKD
jgi:hypothetical protein